MQIEVYGILPFRLLGEASSFGEAKRMQQDTLPEDLRSAYAGIQEGRPLFYTHMLTQELLSKYPNLINAD